MQKYSYNGWAQAHLGGCKIDQTKVLLEIKDAASCGLKKRQTISTPAICYLYSLAHMARVTYMCKGTVNIQYYRL